MLRSSGWTDAGPMAEAHAGHYFWFERVSEMPRTGVIAIVDDDHSVREAVKSLVRSLGYVVMAFECAEDLLKSKRRRKVSCVIADVQMPGMTGLELYDRLVTTGESIPTILITAFPDDGARQRALAAGVAGYLSKPFDENDLLACIHAALGHARGGDFVGR
jgi:FixJ family two-component response regulator